MAGIRTDGTAIAATQNATLFPSADGAPIYVSKLERFCAVAWIILIKRPDKLILLGRPDSGINRALCKLE